jgi:hypothetical protein
MLTVRPNFTNAILQSNPQNQKKNYITKTNSNSIGDTVSVGRLTKKGRLLEPLTEESQTLFNEVLKKFEKNQAVFNKSLNEIFVSLVNLGNKSSNELDGLISVPDKPDKIATFFLAGKMRHVKGERHKTVLLNDRRKALGDVGINLIEATKKGNKALDAVFVNPKDGTVDAYYLEDGHGGGYEEGDLNKKLVTWLKVLTGNNKSAAK